MLQPRPVTCVLDPTQPAIPTQTQHTLWDRWSPRNQVDIVHIQRTRPYPERGRGGIARTAEVTDAGIS